MEHNFPIVCETCLGDNPYLQMTVTPGYKECKECKRPFTVHRWKAGRNGRYKKTEICETCSKLNNVCQVCVLDLQTGLPVQAKDSHESSSYDRVQPNSTISKFQRFTPYYERNRPRVCTFYGRGKCNRGTECPYRHEMPVTGELSKQNIRDRYSGVNDPVASKMLRKMGWVKP